MSIINILFFAWPKFPIVDGRVAFWLAWNAMSGWYRHTGIFFWHDRKEAIASSVTSILIPKYWRFLWHDSKEGMAWSVTSILMPKYWRFSKELQHRPMDHVLTAPALQITPNCLASLCDNHCLMHEWVSSFVQPRGNESTTTCSAWLPMYSQTVSLNGSTRYKRLLSSSSYWGVLLSWSGVF